MKASIFCLPSVGSRAEIEAGMAAMRPELYQRMLKELTELVKLADDLGYDSVSFTEHHFHIEGFELEQSRAARPLRRDADEAHPRRPARDRAAGRQPDPRRRGYRDARSHDRRAGLRRFRPRLPATLGRRHGAADAWRLGDPAAPS